MSKPPSEPCELQITVKDYRLLQVIQNKSYQRVKIKKWCGVSTKLTTETDVIIEVPRYKLLYVIKKK